MLYYTFINILLNIYQKFYKNKQKYNILYTIVIIKYFNLLLVKQLTYFKINIIFILNVVVKSLTFIVILSIFYAILFVVI